MSIAQVASSSTVAADPYPWPYGGALDLARTALVLVDWQMLSDCTGATDPGNHEHACRMVRMQGGVFGAVATSDALLAALAGARPAR